MSHAIFLHTTMKNNFKLKIQLIPFNNWYKNIRAYNEQGWEKIRNEQLKVYKNKCAICGDGKRKLHCHEEWEINDEKLTQKLKGLIILCEYCHHCIHWGRMRRMDNDGTLTKRITEHFLKVNNCDMKTFNRHRNEAWHLWYTYRMTKEYTLDLGEYEPTSKQKLIYDFKERISLFKKCTKRNSHRCFFKDFLDEERFIKNFKNEIVDLLVKCSEIKNGHRIIQHFYYFDRDNPIAVDFFKAMFIAGYKKNHGWGVESLVIKYFAETEFSKNESFFTDIIFKNCTKDEKPFTRLVLKTLYNDEKQNFIKRLFNNSGIISKLNSIEIKSAVNYIENDCFENIKQKEVLKNSLLYSRFISINNN